MALEAVVYQQDLFGHSNGSRDLYSLLDNWGWDFNLPKEEEEQHHCIKDLEDQNAYLAGSWQCNDQDHQNQNQNQLSQPWAATSSPRPKRRRARTRKNQEDIENQRMTHIAVERNRRKQMNEYLSVLKSLMPDSYVQRSDQASIVGGAINFVKELEHNLHFLSAQKLKMNHSSEVSDSLPFGEFFSFPQYSTAASPAASTATPGGEISNVADVEVTMVDSHATLKIRARKRPKQLMSMVCGLQGFRLSILHLNVSTADQFAFYSLSVKVEDDSKLNSADEIATAVHQLLVRIDEASLS